MSNQIKLSKEKLIAYVLILSILLLITFLFSMSIGTRNINVKELVLIFSGRSDDEILNEIIFQLRLPRLLTAMLVGASLSIVGAVFQALLKNPLSEPYILGVSSGGALGAIIAISIGVHLAGISIFAFIGSLLTFLIVFIIGRKFGEIDTATILLVGVMINAFFSALILLIVSMIDQSFRTALFWLMGNLTLTDYSELILISFVFVLSAIVFIFFSNQYNLISIDDENAKQFGVNTKLLKNLTFISGSLLIGIIVSYVGIIGFVGLVVPHICRMIFGYDNRIILPTSIFVGATFMLIADLISRIVLAPIEVPIGSITAIIGSPIFIFLLKHKNRLNGG